MFGLNVTLRNANLSNLLNAIDAGAGPGKLTICNGTRPAAGGALTLVLAECFFSDPSFSTPSAGSMSANAITSDADANNTGVATWGRVEDSNGLFVTDISIGATGSGEDLELNTTSVNTGVNVAISGWTIGDANSA